MGDRIINAFKRDVAVRGDFSDSEFAREEVKLPYVRI